MRSTHELYRWQERYCFLSALLDGEGGRNNKEKHYENNGDRNRGVAWTYYNPPSDLESDCIGEVQAPSKVEEDHMHMQPTAAQIWSEISFDSLVGM
jgi:hypothetical protein